MAARCRFDEMEGVSKNPHTSKNLMKKLTSIAIGVITFKRGIFDESAYKIENFNGTRVPTFKSNSTSETVRTFHTWIEASLRVIHRELLHRLVLGVYQRENDPETMIDCYSFVYDYPKQRLSVTDIELRNFHLETDDSVRQSVRRFIQGCSLLAETGKRPLPERHFFAVHIFYRPGVTSGYTPAVFKKNSIFRERVFEDVQSVPLGNVSTPHYSISLTTCPPRELKETSGSVHISPVYEKGTSVDGDSSKINISTVCEKQNSGRCDVSEINISPVCEKTMSDDSDRSEINISRVYGTEPSVGSDSSDVSLKTMENTEMENDDKENNQSLCANNDVQTKECSQNSRKSLFRPFDVNESQIDDSPLETNNSNVVEYVIVCACESTTSQDQDMITCRICEKQQHAACYGILPYDVRHINKEIMHICEKCAKNDPDLKCTEELFRMSSDEQGKHFLCLIRKVIVYCLKRNKVNADMLRRHFSLTTNESHKLMKALVHKTKVLFAHSPLKKFNPEKMHCVNRQYMMKVSIPSLFQIISPFPPPKPDKYLDNKFSKLSLSKRKKLTESLVEKQHEGRQWKKRMSTNNDSDHQKKRSKRNSTDYYSSD